MYEKYTWFTITCNSEIDAKILNTLQSLDDKSFTLSHSTVSISEAYTSEHSIYSLQISESIHLH
jgi:hypothetical protein